MEQEHGTDAAAICKGVLLRVGMAAAMATAVLGFLSYHVLPRLRKTDYLRMVSDADAQTALTLAPLVLLAICCLCVPADRTREKKPRGRGGRGLHRRLVRPPGSGLGEYGSRENDDPATDGLHIPVLPHARPHDNRRHEGDARMGRPRRQDGPRTTHVHLGRDRLRGGTDRSLESVM